MEIVLFRHGIAESYNILGDAERVLTAEGAAKVKKSAKGLKQLLTDRKRVVVFSSPLQRALQTADLLTLALKARDRYIREEIAEGLFEELYFEWSRYHDETTVIVVGHEPTLGAWLERITGERLALAKGAACAVNTRDLLMRATGKVQWYLTADALIRIAKNTD